MAPIYKEIVLAWKGKDYTVQPSFRMVQLIESSGISILGIVTGFQSGQPLASQMGAIIAHMLRSGGLKGVTADEVYAYIAKSTPEEYRAITTAITMAFLPDEPESGNLEGPGDGAETKTEPVPKTSSTA